MMEAYRIESNENIEQITSAIVESSSQFSFFFFFIPSRPSVGDALINHLSILSPFFFSSLYPHPFRFLDSSLLLIRKD